MGAYSGDALFVSGNGDRTGTRSSGGGGLRLQTAANGQAAAGRSSGKAIAWLFHLDYPVHSVNRGSFLPQTLVRHRCYITVVVSVNNIEVLTDLVGLAVQHVVLELRCAVGICRCSPMRIALARLSAYLVIGRIN